MADPLALLRQDFASALPEISLAVASQDVGLAEQVDAYATGHGFESDPAEAVSRQATLLALLIALRAELDGHAGGAALAAGGPAAAAAVCADGRYRVPLLIQIVESCSQPVENNIAEVAEALRAAPYQDLIGDIYPEAVSQADRRQLGQFWTPAPIAQLMADWAIRSKDATILDQAAGAGALVMPSLRRLAELGAADPVSRLHTNDIDQLVQALLLTGLRAASTDPLENVELADALTTRSDRIFDAIICNPPYTRHHHLGEEYKAAMKALFKDKLGVTTNGFTSLFAYFFLHALTIIKDDGRMSFITPAELLDASYAQAIKKHILSDVNLRAVIYFGEEITAFPRVDTAGMITLVEGGECDGGDIVFIEVDGWPGEETLLKVIEEAKTAKFDWGHSEVRSREDLQTAGKWVVPERHRIRHEEGMVPLSSFCRAMRGIASGNNEFFTLTEQERLDTGVESEFLLPVLIKTRDWTAMSATQDEFDALRAADKKEWLFYCQKKRDELAGTKALEYIEHGESLGVDKGKLVSLRGVWYQLERRTPPDVFYTYLSNGWPRFLRNDLKAQNLNGFHSVYLPEEISSDEDLRDAFCAILNSQAVLRNLRAIGRSYGGGTIKVEPRELDRLLVYDPRTLPAKTVKALAKEFRAGCRSGGVAFEPHRNAIDALLLR